jgi:hypothetical protein
MKFKTSKNKPLSALAMTLIILLPMLCAAISFANATDVPVISVVASGNPGQNIISHQATGTSFSVDIRISGVGTTPGLNGLNLGVTYNASVLQYAGYSNDGKFFVDQVGSSKWSTYTADQATINNGIGKFMATGIIFDALHPALSASGSGILVTVTFNVIGEGKTDITAVAGSGGSAAPLVTAPDGNGGSLDVATTQTKAMYNPVTTVSLFQSGTQNPLVQLPQGAAVINNTVSVDVFISNPLSAPIWGWNLNVNWNTSILQLVDIEEGTFLSSATRQGNGNLTEGVSQTVFVYGNIDNTHGTIFQGISDMYLANVTAASLSGVLCNMTFQIINYKLPIGGNVPIALTANLIDSNELHRDITCVVESANYVSRGPPAPTQPAAVINNQNPMNSGNSLNSAYKPNQMITLDALQSTGGYDEMPTPNSPTYAIATYTWSATNGLLTGVADTTGAQLQFQTPTVSARTTYTITLQIATAPNTADSRYHNTASTTLQIVVGPPYDNPVGGTQIDVYITNWQTIDTTHPFKTPTGTGISNSTFNFICDAFGPQEEMNLAALVTYDNAPVAQKLVTFVVASPTGYNYTFQSTTNLNGIATYTYRLPWFDNTSQAFGMWTVTAFVDVSQVRVSDLMPFQFGYIVGTTNTALSLSNTVAFRESYVGQPTLTVYVNSISNQTQHFWLTYTVFDNNHVPVQQGALNNVAIAPNTQNMANPVPIAVPTWSFVGGATVNVNLFNENPTATNANALPYCPQATNTDLLIVIQPRA